MKIFCYKFKENITLKSNCSLIENAHSRNKIHHSLNYLKKCPYKVFNKLKYKILKIIKMVYKLKHKILKLKLEKFYFLILY